MKRIALAVSVVLLMGVQASAMDCGTGGIIYWNDVVANITDFPLWSLAYDTTFTKVTVNPVNFDCVTHINTYTSWPRYTQRRNVEVYDPRVSGGTGTLSLVAITNHTPPSSGYTAASYNEPFDVVRINPNTLSHTLLADGRLGGAGWDSKQLGTALTAPANWVPGTTSNGISLAIQRGIWANNVSALYDTNTSGVIDNTTAEGAMFARGGQFQYQDAEFGGDKALYRSVYAGFTWNAYVPVIDRMYPKSTTTAGDQVYLNTNTAAWRSGGVIGKATDGDGIAVSRILPNTTAPTVYLIAMTNDNVTQQASHLALFALRDVNSDNTITLGTDIVTKIWEQGQFGVSAYSDSIYGGEDVELTTDPNTGKMTLFFNDYGGGIYAFSLADNGLSVVGNGKVILTSAGPDGYGAGFEVDMTPPVGIPEPATMLLLGTGALGVMGWMRRRRMK